MIPYVDHWTIGGGGGGEGLASTTQGGIDAPGLRPMKYSYTRLRQGL